MEAENRGLKMCFLQKFKGIVPDKPTREIEHSTASLTLLPSWKVKLLLFN